MSDDDTRTWSTVEEIAEELRLSARAVRRLIRDEGLPAYKLGKEYRIARHELERWLAERRTV